MPDRSDLLVSTSAPGKLYFGPSLPDDLFFEGVPAKKTMQPPWPTLPDILWQPDSKEFLGLIFRVGKEYSNVVKASCAGWDGRIFQFMTGYQASQQDLYAEGPNEEGEHEVDFLLTFWSSKRPFVARVAQLVECVWIYNEIIPTAYDDEAIKSILAVGIEDFGDTLETERVSKPDFLDLGNPKCTGR
jgi:hypothetical protein